MQYGEIVQLGRHRLMCGDATKYEDIEALLGGDRVNLVLTDPPYGIRVVNEKTGGIGAKGRAYAPVIGDTNGDMFTEHYRIIRCLSNRLIVWGGQNLPHDGDFTRILRHHQGTICKT